MKKWIMAAAALACFGISAQAQEEVSLDSFDKCNNWARQYCQIGAHETAVNAELLRLKKAGVPITVERIKMMAQSINPHRAEAQAQQQ
ncbi:MAG: hypothetical protein RRB13_00955 [bacterium]|nr:hypothetical protein [bacterium]